MFLEEEVDIVVEKLNAFKSMSKLLKTFDKNFLTAYYEQVKHALASNFNDIYGSM